MHAHPSPVLFGLERSVYTRIARLALEEKAVPYSLQEVEIFGPEGAPKEHFQAASVRAHSRPAARCVVSLRNERDRSIRGRGLPGPRAATNQPVTARSDEPGHRHSGLLRIPPDGMGYLCSTRPGSLEWRHPDEPQIGKSLRSSATCLGALEALLSTAPFFAGGAISLADLHAFPMLRYLCLAPEGLALFRRHQALLRWYEEMLVRPSASTTASRYEQA